MKSIANYLIPVAMIGGGVVAMAMTSRSLANHEARAFPINPLGVNRSPYGGVLAMAMQGPIDTFWTQGELAKVAPSQRKETSHSATSLPWNQRLRVFLEELDQASTARTNTHRASKALDFHIRRQVENKLRFAYQLDPANYGNYNSYHFFLTEPQVGTRRILTPAAAQLARDTIEYCLLEAHDPRPALTAAAAATNVIHLMFADRQNEVPIFTAAQMRETLNLLDHCIAKHIAIREEWTASGHDQLLSPMRVVEMEERFIFVLRIRDAAEPAVIRFENEEMGAQATDEK